MARAGSLYVGAISGTSVDGLDLALVRIETSGVTILHGATIPFPPELRLLLIDLGQGLNDDLDHLGHADSALGQFTGEAIATFTRECAHEGAIQAIGWHGQTVRHRPDDSLPFTMQIGDPNLIAEICRITTIADFRRRDMAAGGQAAPLVPPFHAALFSDPLEPRVIANIGGISNITILRADAPLVGFDTGPGNALLDAWYQAHHREPYDANGRWASTGEISHSLLARLMADPFLCAPPPKSTGKEHYNLKWLRGHLADERPQDVQRTALAFTAKSLADAVSRHASAASHVYVCGGGRLNEFLMGAIAAELEGRVAPVEALGVNGDALEAAAFAWLAHQRLAGLPGNAPSVTGATGSRILGGVYSA